jgi:hypothetical protein
MQTYEHQFSPGFGQNFSLVLSHYSQFDAFYVAAANFSGKSSQPPWTSTDYGFFPPKLENQSADGGFLYFEAQQLGYGADLHCLELTKTPSNASYELVFNSNASEIELLASLRQPDGSKIVCVGNIDGLGFIGQPRPGGVWALEFAGGMAPNGPGMTPTERLIFTIPILLRPPVAT